MAQPTNREIMTVLNGIVNKVDKLVTKHELDIRLKKLETKLNNKIDEYHTVNIKHHLETKASIGKLADAHNKMRDGLLAAAGYSAN